MTWLILRLPTRRRIASIVASPPGVFFLLALAIMGPLLMPGHVLALDSPIAINRDIAGYFWGYSDGPQSVFAATYNSAPIAAVMWVLELGLPDQLVQKLILIALFWLAGFGASRLPRLQGAGQYYAGALYALSPFIYIRFAAGQWGILGAYALAPFAVTSFIGLLEAPRCRAVVTTVLLLTAIGLFQTHGLLLVGMILLVIYLHRIVTTPGALRRTAKPALQGLALFAGVNLFWIVRFATASGVVDNIGRAELSYFAASPALDVLSLRGFWLDGPYTDISDLIAVWWLLFVPILFLAVYGALRMTRRPTIGWLGLSLASVGLLGAALAVGPGLAFTEPIYDLLWDHVPAYRAFRDSHKFLLLTALAYAYLGGYGVQSIFGQRAVSIGRRVFSTRLAVAPVLALPLVYGLPILFGAWGQLSPDDFPDDWYEVRSVLDSDSEDYNILVLPWHMYLDAPWLDNRWKRLANPAPSFFSQPTISGDNIEAGLARTNSSNPVSRYVEALLNRGDSVGNFGNLIAPLNARYVVLFKTADYRSFDFLREQVDLSVVLDGETIALFRNEGSTARAYAPPDVVSIGTLDEYFDLSPQPAEHAYVLSEGGGLADAASSSRREGPPATTLVEMASAISYRVEQSGGGYLIFTLPQRTARAGWEYQGHPAEIDHLGMMPAFEAATPSSGSVTYTRFYRVHLPLYALAVTSLVAAGVWWRRSQGRP